ncbi:MAG: 8-oxoguanine deaminase [Proteobacteria bacterium]|nr:MAG: 8-oxoguanine deaminase [Pseudomonadota bacterium]
MTKTTPLLLKDIYHLALGTDDGGRRRGVDVLIEDGRVAAIGDNLSATQLGSDAPLTTIDCSTKLVIPGLVNTHHHMYQTLQRNIPAVQNAPLFEWLVNLYPIWSHLTAEAVEVSTQLACAELLATGCTTSSDHHYLFPNAVTDELIDVQIAAAARMGMRFCATRGSMSRGKDDGGLPPQSVVQKEEAILDDSARLLERYHDPSPLSMCRVALAPCSPFSVSEQLMKQTTVLARKHGVMLHTHLAETLDEEQYCEAHYGCRPLELMRRWEWVGPDVWYAHGVHFDDAELELLAETETGVAHCPSSNMRLGSGICRVPEMLDKGIRVGLAVDGSASNDSSDMLGELRNALLLSRVRYGPSAMTADQVLKLATHGSASLLGWEAIGSVEVGKAADLAIFEMQRLDYAGALSDPLAAIIFSGASHRAHTTIVNGKVVLREGKLLGAEGILDSQGQAPVGAYDEDELRDRANAISRQMLEAEGHDTRWMP